MANVIARIGRPALVMPHNKTLAAQLYGEFREFFPHNAVGYFVSYYDYYQPEAYIPQRDIYIEKDASINDEIDRLRLAATSALLARRDVIVVATVSLHLRPRLARGLPQLMVLRGGRGATATRSSLQLVDIQYERNDVGFERGKFRVRGDAVEVWPAYEEIAYRIELFGDEVESLTVIDPLTGAVLERLKRHVRSTRPSTSSRRRRRSKRAVEAIQHELEERLDELQDAGQAPRGAAAARRAPSTTWRCSWRSATARASRTTPGTSPAATPGETPNTLLDFFPDDFLLLHRRVARHDAPDPRDVRRATASARATLVEHGFRLPQRSTTARCSSTSGSAVNQAVFVSATPGDYELAMSEARSSSRSSGRPAWSTRSSRSSRPQGQVADLLGEVSDRADAGRARPGHHAHQAAGRGPHRLPRRGGRPGALPALRARRLRAHHASSASCGTGSSTCWSASTCSARGSTCPRSRWSHPRRRQGGLPPQRDVADPDDRPRRPERRAVA